MQLHVRKLAGALVPMPEEREKFDKLAVGEIMRVSITRPRNAGFHRKWFALAHILFEMWSESLPTLTFRGLPVQPSFDKFRHDLVVLAGHGTPVYNIKGEVRVEADSISFASMDADTFEDLYSKTIDVGLRVIIPHGRYDEAGLRNAVAQVLEFDS